MTAGLLEIGEPVLTIRKASEGRPRVLVGIDGPGASGKSTLAAKLGEAIGNAFLIHSDDFYLPSSRRQERLGEVGRPSFDLQRLAEQAVRPGAAGDAFRYQRYDWTLDTLAEWIVVPARMPVIVEGVFCLSDLLREAYTFTIWCRADSALRLARGLQRDGNDAEAAWVDVWMPAEDEYARTQNPGARRFMRR